MSAQEEASALDALGESGWLAGVPAGVGPEAEAEEEEEGELVRGEVLL